MHSTEPSPRAPHQAPVHHLVLMGVCGSGKTTVAGILADRTGYEVAEADDFHPRANVEKMASGIPLTDADRWPWLERLRNWMDEHARAGKSAIVTCSALKRSYRELLRQCQAPVTFVHLHGPKETLAARMAARTNHFMPAGLLDSQLATLQPLEADEAGLVVDISDSPQQIATQIMEALALPAAASHSRAGCPALDLEDASVIPVTVATSDVHDSQADSVPDGDARALRETDHHHREAETTRRVQAAGSAQIGVYGLGVMGTSLARNLARHGFTVAVYNIDTNITDSFMERYRHEGDFVPTYTEGEFAAALRPPRVAALLVTAGAVTDAVTDRLADLFQPADVIIDMGNSLFTDTRAREVRLRERGIHLVGCGTSGGEEGALHGPSLMVGGSAHAYAQLSPMFHAIAAKAEDGKPCCAHVGTDGAGHFVKMVHNGIEYADMQLIAEAYALLRSLGLPVSAIAQTFQQWNEGELGSYLIDITAQILSHTDAHTGEAFIDIIADAAGQKGTGNWTLQQALQLGVPVTAIADATMERMLSVNTETRSATQAALGSLPPSQDAVLAVEDNRTGQEETVELIRQALYAAKIVSYAQGLELIKSGAATYGWDIELAQVAQIWRAGCIIRANFLDQVARAYRQDPKLVSLLAAPDFAPVLTRYESAWRKVAALSIERAVPAPALASTLHYLTALRSSSLPTALVQAQRDFFGAHTYLRRDREGVFHTLWAVPDRPEHQV